MSRGTRLVPLAGTESVLSFSALAWKRNVPPPEDGRVGGV